MPRHLRGHRRQEIAVGEIPTRNRPPSGGWDVSCICGWQGGNWRTASLARDAYSEHLDYEINHCLVTCKFCGAEKHVSEMRPDYRYMCLVCFSKKGNEWQRRNPSKSRVHKLNYLYRKLYGITLIDAEEILAEQCGVCAICQNPLNFLQKRSAQIDHNHKTGQRRGVLCFRCNAGLGSFKDDPTRLMAAIEYLKKYADETS